MNNRYTYTTQIIGYTANGWEIRGIYSIIDNWTGEETIVNE